MPEMEAEGIVSNHKIGQLNISVHMNLSTKSVIYARSEVFLAVQKYGDPRESNRKSWMGICH